MEAMLNGKLLRRISGLVVLIALCLLSLAATANGGHGHHGGRHVFIGLGFGAYWPRYYLPDDPYHYSSYPPVAPIYVERGDAQAAPQSVDWYYCVSPQGYYPHVTQCPGGWQRVKTQPPS